MLKKFTILIVLIILVLSINKIYSLSLLEKPINLNAVQEDYKVRLTWQLERSDPDIAGFEVFKSENNESFYSLGKAYKNQLYFLDYSIYLDKTYYYMIKSYDKDGNYSEPSNIVSIKIVDNKPPELRILEPSENNYYTKDEKLPLLIGVKDNMSGLKTLLVNGVKINQCGCSTFTETYTLKEGKNEFLIIAEDNRGNKSSLTLIVFLDKTPPEINTKIPVKTYEESLKLSGKVFDSGIGVKKAYVNNIELILDKDGNFETLLLLKEGENEIKFRLIDKLDNEKEETFKVSYIKRKILKLFIDSDKFIVNGIEKNIDAKPEIKNGRTFLPIRPIIEELGGEIFWVGNEKKVTIKINNSEIVLFINSPYAYVNNMKVQIDENLDVKPYIKNGRTFLPLRFIVENIGGTVNWNSSERSVTITYP